MRVSRRPEHANEDAADDRSMCQPPVKVRDPADRISGRHAQEPRAGRLATAGSGPAPDARNPSQDAAIQKRTPTAVWGAVYARGQGFHARRLHPFTFRSYLLNRGKLWTT